MMISKLGWISAICLVYASIHSILARDVPTASLPSADGVMRNDVHVIFPRIDNSERQESFGFSFLGFGGEKATESSQKTVSDAESDRKEERSPQFLFFSPRLFFPEDSPKLEPSPSTPPEPSPSPIASESQSVPSDEPDVHLSPQVPSAEVPSPASLPSEEREDDDDDDIKADLSSISAASLPAEMESLPSSPESVEPTVSVVAQEPTESSRQSATPSDVAKEPSDAPSTPIASTARLDQESPDDEPSPPSEPVFVLHKSYARVKAQHRMVPPVMEKHAQIDSQAKEPEDNNHSHHFSHNVKVVSLTIAGVCLSLVVIGNFLGIYFSYIKPRPSYHSEQLL